MSDDMVDPKGWLTALESIRAFHPALVVGTDGDGSKLVENELTGTRTYITRVLDLIMALQQELGFALVIATHDADIAARLARVVTLEDGRVVASSGLT